MYWYISNFTPTCFSNSLPSSGSRITSEATQAISVLWMYVDYSLSSVASCWRDGTKVASLKSWPNYRASFFIWYNEPTNAQLIDKLLHCPYTFRHCCVIFTELVVSTLLSYAIMSMQMLVLQLKISYVFFCWISVFKMFKILILS
jgi:hypothetical protein